MPSPVAAAALFGGGQADPLQAANGDAWQQFLAQQQLEQQLAQQQQQQQPTYNPTTNTTPAPFNTEHAGGFSPLVQGTTGHYDVPAGSTSRGPASPLVAPGDLEAGPPSIDQV